MRTNFRNLDRRLTAAHEFFAKVCKRNKTDYQDFAGTWAEYKEFLNTLADEIEFVAIKLKQLRMQSLETALKDSAVKENLDILVPLYAGGDYMFRAKVSKSGNSYFVALKKAVREIAKIKKDDRVIVKIKKV